MTSIAVGPGSAVTAPGARRARPFGPGSAVWLLRHDLRLAGRDLRSASPRKRRVVGLVLLATVVLLHLIGFAVAPDLARLHDRYRSEALLIGSFAFAGVFMLFLSKAVSEATDALFQRGDLDLLLSSPLPMRRVLTTRLLAIAVNAGFLPLLLVVPVVNGMVLRGQFAWIGVYPVLASLSVIAAAAGAAITFGLLASVGPRWTRVAARGLATLFGAFSFFATQARILLPEQVRTSLWHTLLPATDAVPNGPQWWPARAALGEAVPILALAGFAVAALLAVSAALGQAYGTGVMSNLALTRSTRAGGLERRFRDGPFAALLRKEWRLLVRHPGLGAQLFYQFVFLAPGAIALKNIGESGWHSSAGVVFLTAMMTGRITKVVVAAPFEADQVAALAISSPIGPRLAMRAKVLVTVATLTAIAALPLGAIGLKMAPAFPAAFIACAAATWTRMWLAVSHPARPRRSAMQQRLQPSTDGLLGIMIDIGWGVAGAVLTVLI